MNRRRGITALLAALALALPAPAAGQGAADSAAAPRPPRHDWTADRRRFVEGDIVTVLVDEYTLASANKSSAASQDRSRRAGLSAGGGSGGAGTSVDASVRSSLANDSRARGQTTRSDRLTSEITVRVVGIEPGGLLRIEGRKRLAIDDHEQEVLLTGFLRPEDIPASNVVDSWRVADAVISYRSNDRLDRPKGGVLGRVFGWVWP